MGLTRSAVLREALEISKHVGTPIKAILQGVMNEACGSTARGLGTRYPQRAIPDSTIVGHLTRRPSGECGIWDMASRFCGKSGSVRPGDFPSSDCSRHSLSVKVLESFFDIGSSL